MMKPGPKGIDWPWITRIMADHFGKPWTTERDMWDYLYVRLGWGVRQIERVMGVSHITILSRLRALEYQIRPRGGANHVRPAQGKGTL
jgi:hypothetical protein